MKERKKNYFLNYLKGIACLGVVFLHVTIPNSTLDGLIQSMFRVAVPMFFMISGYFVYNDDFQIVSNKVPQKVKHLLKFGFVGILYYFIIQMLVALLGDQHGSMDYLLKTLKQIFSLKSIFDFIIFNVDPVINILWFIFSLVYCYVILYFINKYNLYKFFYWLIPVLLLANLTMGNGLTLVDIEIDKIYYRNFLFFGLPFFLLGNVFHRHIKCILNRMTNLKCYLFSIIGILLGFGEWFLVGRQELYLGSILVLISLFVYAMRNGEKKEKSIITLIGDKYSLFIYIIHISVAMVLDKVIHYISFEYSHYYTIYQYSKPIIIMILSIFSACLFYFLISAIKKNLKNSN